MIGEVFNLSAEHNMNIRFPDFRSHVSFNDEKPARLYWLKQSMCAPHSGGSSLAGMSHGIGNTGKTGLIFVSIFSG